MTEAIRPAALVGLGRMGRGPTGSEPGTTAEATPVTGPGRLTGSAGDEAARPARAVRRKVAGARMMDSRNRFRGAQGKPGAGRR